MAYLWLTTKSRKEIMKAHSFYSGLIDSARDEAYYEAVGKVNREFLPKKFHKDLYYKETDIVLRNLRAMDRAGLKNFKLDEFKCNCGGKYCSGYPMVLNQQLLENLGALRERYGPIAIRGGMRCVGYNNVLVKRGWAIKNSGHRYGKALDIDVLNACGTVAGRRKVMADWKKLPKYKYTYCDEGGNHENMGRSVHVEVK